MDNAEIKRMYDQGGIPFFWEDKFKNDVMHYCEEHHTSWSQLMRDLDIYCQFDKTMTAASFVRIAIFIGKDITDYVYFYDKKEHKP